MSTPLSRSFVAATYLSGARGKELLQRVPGEVAQLEPSLLRGLQSEDRDVRARFLAAAVRDLSAELNGRVLQANT